jgi:hypothetical protein
MSYRPFFIRRLRLRFGLRSLLVLIAVTAAGVGLAAQRVADMRIQRSVAAELQRLGGYVRWDAPQPLPNWLARLAGEEFLANVDLVECDGPSVNDETLVQLEKLHGLTWLMLDSDRITDQGLRRIANLSELGRLDLASRQITDAGLVALERLSNLRWLALRRTQVTLAGVERLRGALPECHIQWQPKSEPASAAPSPDKPRSNGTLDLTDHRLAKPARLR